MENDYNKQELIEAYLKGQLSDEALAAFEWQLKVDEELAQEVELHRQLESMLTNVEEGELQNYSSSLLEEAREQEQNNGATDEKVIQQQIVADTAETSKWNPLWYLLPLAAALLLFFGIYWLIPDRSVDAVAEEQKAAYDVIAKGKANAVQSEEDAATAIATNSSEETVVLEPIDNTIATDETVVADATIEEEGSADTVEETTAIEEKEESTTVDTNPTTTSNDSEELIEKPTPVTTTKQRKEATQNNVKNANATVNYSNRSTPNPPANYNRPAVRNTHLTQLGHQYRRGFDSRRPELSGPTQLYKQGNYRGAISQLENNRTLTGDGLLLSGICHAELGELRRAINIFVNLINRPGYGAKDEARWQLALAYLKKNDAGKAVRELQQIANNGGNLANQSRQLLSQIQR